MSKITKTHIATMLASIEPSVAFGNQSSAYWYRQWMRQTSTECVARLRKAADRATTKGSGYDYLSDQIVDQLVEMAMAVEAQLAEAGIK